MQRNQFFYFAFPMMRLRVKTSHSNSYPKPKPNSNDHSLPQPQPPTPTKTLQVKNSNPFLVCNKVCNNLRPATDFCQKSYLAIISNSSELTYTAFGLKTYIETTYPKTANDPNDEFTIIFPSMSSLNSYITSPSYPTSKQIGFTISLSSTSSGVSTVLRTNGTFHSNIEDSRPGIFTTPDTSFLFNHFANGPSESCKLKPGAPKGEECGRANVSVERAENTQDSRPHNIETNTFPHVRCYQTFTSNVLTYIMFTFLLLSSSTLRRLKHMFKSIHAKRRLNPSKVNHRLRRFRYNLV